MFNKITPKTDSQLTSNDVANLILSDALDKISQITGVNQQQALTLLAEQINHASDKTLCPSKQAPLAIIEQTESLFISSLFS